MKNKRLCISVLCVLAFFISTINVYATDVVVQAISIIENNEISENKIFCTATIDDDFLNTGDGTLC